MWDPDILQAAIDNRAGRGARTDLAKETTMTTTTELEARYVELISPETRAAVQSVVEHTIDAEYGRQDPDGLNGAHILAAAGISMDWHRLWVDVNGDNRHLPSAAVAQLRIMVTAGLEARRCACTADIAPSGHRHVDYQCTGHTEHDVPAVYGLLFCGSCYPVYADAAGIPQ